MGHSDHAQVNVLPAQAYLQDVMPGRQQRGCRCQRPHESAVPPHFLVLPSVVRSSAERLPLGFRPAPFCPWGRTVCGQSEAKGGNDD